MPLIHGHTFKLRTKINSKTGLQEKHNKTQKQTQPKAKKVLNGFDSRDVTLKYITINPGQWIIRGNGGYEK